MSWTRSDVIALGREGCAQCLGRGTKDKFDNAVIPCNCVLRAVFQACYAKFRYCATLSPHMRTARLERVPGAVNGPMAYARKNEEYIADFCLIAKRTLTNELEYNIFRFHMLLGADWKACCKRLGMNRGPFYHAVYRIQEKLGLAFHDTDPYPLFPTDAYFGGSTPARTAVCAVSRQKAVPIRAPLADLPEAA